MGWARMALVGVLTTNNGNRMTTTWIPRANRFTTQEREARKLADIAKRRESRAHWQRLANMLTAIREEIAPKLPPEVLPGGDYAPRERLQWKYLATYGVGN